MGRPRKPRCREEDCNNCPYDDCIGILVSSEKKKPGRKKLDPEVVHQHRLAYQRRYNEEHKEKQREYYKNYYKKNEEHIKELQKNYRERKKSKA